jgi:hypothetical protein
MVAGAAGSAAKALGFHRVALTRDKAREITASHWSLGTRSSLERLGLETWVDFDEGAAAAWSWYRTIGWL